MQKLVWSLLNRGLSHSQVAEELKKSPQYVHQTRRNAEHKLSRALTEIAEATNLQIKKLRVKEGLLWGYHPGIQCDIIVSYTVKSGLKVWHWVDEPEAITDKDFLHETRSYLLNLAEEHGILLTEEQKNKHPANLANLIFKTLFPGVQS